MFMLALSAVSFAHMALEEPLPRYPTDGNGANKACPCGVGESNRMCDVPSDRSDPDRSTDITTYMPGETITMRWRETIGHAGRWRIAFDADGADLSDFNDQILLDIEDPGGSAGNMGGDLWEVQVTLPNVPCDNCTLQLVQIMDGETEDPVPDPVGRSSYYQCADIVIEGEPLATEATGDTAVPGDDDDDDDDVPSDVDSGCGCAAGSAAPPAAFIFLGTLAIAARRRRQQRGHRPTRL